MAKVYECGFTSSGYNQVDTVGGVTLTLSGSSTYSYPMSGFMIRPGWTITTGSVVPTSNNRVLYFDDSSRPTKTIVIWFKPVGGYLTGGYLLGGGTTFNRDGLYFLNDVLRFYTDGTDRGQIFSAAEIEAGQWRMVAVAEDRLNSVTRLYGDGVPKNTLSGVIISTGSPQTASFGGNTDGNGVDIQVGLIQVYNTFLSTTEIANLWNTGLIDAPSQSPLLTLSGYVFDLDEYPVSGAMVRVFSHTNSRIESWYTTTSSGTYTAYFDTVGEYSLEVSKPATAGGRVVPITVTSGGYIVHDT